MRRVVDVLICAVSTIVWLPSGLTQPITAEQFQQVVEERVVNLSSVSNEAYRNILGNINQSCPYGNQLYDTCSITLQPDDVAFDAAFMRNISSSSSSVYFRLFLAGYAAEFSSIDDYRAVEDLFPRLCMSEALSNSWISLGNSSGSSVNNIDGLLWHFYGDDQSAIIRTYPYFSHDPSSDLCTRRQLDPRFRPWYVSTTTSSKALYVLLHSNNVDMLPLMGQAAIRFVNTLSHQDYFYIILTDDVDSHFSDDFVLTNQSTREEIEMFIKSSTEQQLTPTVNIALQLDNAFQLFESLANQSSVCHQAIIILSDSSLDQSIVDRVDVLKQSSDSGQQIDIYTVIFGIEADDEYAAMLSCSNGGDHYVVMDMAGVDEAVASYYKFYSTAVAMETNNSEVSWSEVYSDFFLGEEVLSACLPVWDQPTAVLLGVTCIDVNVTYFTSLTDGEQVVSELLNTSSVTCPSTDLTEDIRNQLRTYKYCVVPANLSTVDQVIALYEDSVEQVVDLLISARRDLQNIESTQMCPFEATVYDACSDDMLPYSFNPRLHNNVSNVTSNVNFSPTTLNQLDSFSLVDYPISSSLFKSLCYSSVAKRRWHRLLTLDPQATLQYYASEEGFIRLYPAIRYAMCYPPSYDPRTRPFYAATASGRKDVVMVIDITNSNGIPVAIAAVEDILNTLSLIDYFNVITSSNGSFSSTGLTAATEGSKNLVNEIYLPSVVAMISNQSSLVAMAFEAFIDGRNNNNTANCQTAIIIITDRQVSSDTAEIVASGNRNVQSMYQTVPAKLFVTSLTDNVNGYYDVTALQLTCDHSGIWNKVSSEAYSHDSTVSVISYYRVLANAVMVTQPVWSEIYEDYAGTGDVVTVCQPHYDESINIGQLLGVACADLTTEMLQQVGARNSSIEQLIDQQRLLACRPEPVSDTTLEQLRPVDAKCLSPPPTTSSVSSAVVTTAASSAPPTTDTAIATPTSDTTIASATPTSNTALVSATPTSDTATASATPTTDTIIASATPTSDTATTSATPTNTSAISSTTPNINSTTSGSSSDDQLTGGAIAGIVIACLVVVTILLIVFIGWYHYHNIRRYRLQDTYKYKRFAQGKEFHNNELSDALVSEVENDEGDEL